MILEQGNLEQLNSRNTHSQAFVSRDHLQRLAEQAPVGALESGFPKGREKIDDNKLDLNRQTGDWTVYRYYLNSIGWDKTVILLAVIIIFVFGNEFPSRLPRRPRRTVHRLTC